MSQFSKIKTSPALPPYYSLKSTGICSTSHSSIVLEARRRQHMRQHEKNQKNESQNSSEWWVSGRIFEIFPEAPEWLVWLFYHVFWCSGALGTVLEWFWIDLGPLIFYDFLKNFCQNSNVGISQNLSKMNRSEHWWCQSKLKYIKNCKKLCRAKVFHRFWKK